MGELLTHLVELMVYVVGQGCPWIVSPVTITLLGVGVQHSKENDVKTINKTDIHPKKAPERDSKRGYVQHIKKYLGKKCNYVKIY